MSGATKLPSDRLFLHVLVKAIKLALGAWTGPSSSVLKDLRMGGGKQSSLRQGAVDKYREQKAIGVLPADRFLVRGCLAD